MNGTDATPSHDLDPVMVDFMAAEWPWPVTVVRRRDVDGAFTASRLKDWHCLDVHQGDPYYGCTLGSSGEPICTRETGPYQAAYAILRELFGQRYASANERFLERAIEEMDWEQGFLLCESDITQIVLGRRFSGDEVNDCYCKSLRRKAGLSLDGRVRPVLKPADAADAMLLSMAEKGLENGEAEWI